MVLEELCMEVIRAKLSDNSEEWSKVIQRLASVNLWPQGKDGVVLALQLVGVELVDIEKGK